MRPQFIAHQFTLTAAWVLALLAFQFPTIGQWLAGSLGPVHAFGPVAGGGGE